MSKSKEQRASLDNDKIQVDTRGATRDRSMGNQSGSAHEETNKDGATFVMSESKFTSKHTQGAHQASAAGPSAQQQM